jgi:hypothetical protein
MHLQHRVKEGIEEAELYATGRIMESKPAMATALSPSPLARPRTVLTAFEKSESVCDELTPDDMVL